MAEDHARLDRLLAASDVDDGSIDPLSYARFRHDLLRHIAMEEKILLPFARALCGGEPLPIAATLRADHGRIAKLLVRSPSTARIADLRATLARHNPLEEGPAGLYATCDALAGEGAGELVARLRAQPSVPVAKYNDVPSHRVR